MLKLPYTPLTLEQTKTEEDFFKSITPLIIDKYNAAKDLQKQSYTIIYIDVSVPTATNQLFDYGHFNQWFVKPNFKYTFYKHVPYSATTLYIDHIFINQYYISNDIAESPIYKLFINTVILRSLFYFVCFLFYTKETKSYITMEFIIREPRP